MSNDTKRKKVVRVVHNRKYENTILVGTNESICKWIVKNQEFYELVDICKWFNKVNHEPTKEALIGIDEDEKHKTMVFPITPEYYQVLTAMDQMKQITDMIYFDIVKVIHV